MLTLHTLLGTWHKMIDVYVVLNEFHRRKLIEAGFPSEKIVVKPNCLTIDPGPKKGIGDYALFVGRLSAGKGIATLLQAWTRMKEIPLKVVGDGSEMGWAHRYVTEHDLRNVELLGRRLPDEVRILMKNARFLVFPSENYENFPVTIAEAFGCGLPVLASRLGAMEEIISAGRNGQFFTAGDARDLALQAEHIWANPRWGMEMGWEARRDFEAKYSAEKNHEMLMSIYASAINRAQNHL